MTLRRMTGVSEQWWDLKSKMRKAGIRQRAALANNDGI